MQGFRSLEVCVNVGLGLFVALSVCYSRPPVLSRLVRVVSSWLRRLLLRRTIFGSGRGFDSDTCETTIACAPSLHAPRAGTWLTVYRAPQVYIVSDSESERTRKIFLTENELLQDFRNVAPARVFLARSTFFEVN